MLLDMHSSNDASVLINPEKLHLAAFAQVAAGKVTEGCSGEWLLWLPKMSHFGRIDAGNADADRFGTEVGTGNI